MEEKETKSKFWKGVLVGALAMALFALIVVSAAAGIWIVARKVTLYRNQPGQNQSLQAGAGAREASDKLDMSKIVPKLQYMEELVNQYFLFDEEENEKKESAEDWIYSGYMYSLRDPYSSYYNAEEYASLAEDNSGSYCGIGVQVSQNVYTGLISVIKVFKGTPAEEAGMLPEDIIYKVGDIEATGTDLSLLISDHIKGEEGTKVMITVYRSSIDDYVEMEVERRMVENPTVEYEMLAKKIGYISLSSFEEVSTHQFISAVDALEAEGMKGLIVDLRNNGGGVTQAAEDIADYLLPEEKTIVSFKGKGMPDSIFYSDDGHSLDLPTVLLVNGESASSSEVLTGALKDNGQAVVVGTQTFGKGIAQGIFPMADGSALKLTTAYYYTPSGECIHEIGIEPDVVVELDEEVSRMVEIPKEKDDQLQAAIDVILKGKEAVKETLAAQEKETEGTKEVFTFPSRQEENEKESTQK